MSNKKYKIAVLAELTDAISTTFSSSVSLAKLIDAEISLLCLEKPTDVVKKDNQLSAIREINGKYTSGINRLKTLTRSVNSDFGITVNYSFVVGQIKDEIKKYIEEQQPDIIVIGKKKSNLLKIADGNLTKYILKYHSGIILITDQNKPITLDKALNFGIFNSNRPLTDIEMLKALMPHTQKPIKSFKMVEDLNAPTEYPISIGAETVEFVFGQNNNSLETLSNYLKKNNVDLLYIDRAKNNSNRNHVLKKDINTIVNGLHVSVLLSAQNPTSPV